MTPHGLVLDLAGGMLTVLFAAGVWFLGLGILKGVTS